ncbi:MAG TPA: SpoIIE family protein phosphatase [Vicinamibacterales bacterium]|nr:SpoIIE family protein phosphatase [Vicinamibacterales bacterium]
MTRPLSVPAFLRSTDLLREAPADLLERVAAQMRPLTLDSGVTLFREGDAAPALYLIVSGSVRVEKDGIVLATRGAGECVGEFAMMDAGVRSASVVADAATELLEWSAADAWQALSYSPDLRRAIFRLVIGKFRQDVAAQVAAAIERAEIERELARARDIQRAMLPPVDLALAEIAVSGLSTPATHVGGDYFDVVATTPRSCSVVLADVAGHGLHAALLVAMAKSCFQTQVHADADTAGIVQALNQALWLSTGSHMMMTAVSVTIDASAGLLSYTNAGHPPMLHLSEGRPAWLGATDPLLGLEALRHATFGVERRPWRAGDRLVLYTDGVSEACNPAGEEFGRDRIAGVLLEVRSEPAERIRRALIDTVATFSGGRTQDDDLTVVVVEGRVPC